MIKKFLTLLFVLFLLTACVDDKIIDKLITGQALTPKQAETYRGHKEQYDRLVAKKKEELTAERLIYKLAQGERFLPKDELQLYSTDPEGFSKKAKEKQDELIKEGRYHPQRYQSQATQQTQPQEDKEGVSLNERKTKFPPISKIPPIE